MIDTNPIIQLCVQNQILTKRSEDKKQDNFEIWVLRGGSSNVPNNQLTFTVLFMKINLPFKLDILEIEKASLTN